MSRSKTFTRIRVTVLAAILAGVVFYAVHDVRSRRERSEWNRTLEVALVIVTDGAVDESAVAAVRRRVPDLAAQLRLPFERYRGAGFAPFAFGVYGPVPLERSLPSAPSEELTARLRFAFELQRFTSDVDDRASVPSRGFDARVYVVVRPASERAAVEGMSEHGGRIGVAIAELDPENVDAALFVTAHELFHTLGASDRYGADGRTLLPEGLAEPERVPRFPQRYAEVMARNRPLSETEEARPESLAELWVGAGTASEVGWARGP